MSNRVLIWGAGAIGGTVGAYLKRAGHDVTFVDVVGEHVAAIAAPGLSITGPIDNFRISAPAFTAETLEGEWDAIYLCVKAHHTAEATRALLPHLAAEGYVLSLQNGLCEGVIAEIAGAGRVVGRSSISARIGWRRGRSCTAAGGRSCSVNWTGARRRG